MCYTVPEIHLWRDTCLSLGSHYGSLSWSLPHTFNQASVGLKWETYRATVECPTNWAMPARLDRKRPNLTHIVLVPRLSFTELFLRKIKKKLSNSETLRVISIAIPVIGVFPKSRLNKLVKLAKTFNHWPKLWWELKRGPKIINLMLSQIGHWVFCTTGSSNNHQFHALPCVTVFVKLS